MTQNRDHNDHVLFPDINFRPTTSKSRNGQTSNLKPKRKPRFRWIFLIILAGIVFGGSLTLAWYSYMRGYDKASDEFAPHITADETPIKMKPEDAGGMKIPHRDRHVYDIITPPENREQKVENLLAEPEVPIRAAMEETKTGEEPATAEHFPEKEKIIELIESKPAESEMPPIPAPPSEQPLLLDVAKETPKEAQKETPKETPKETLEEQLAKILPEIKSEPLAPQPASPVPKMLAQTPPTQAGTYRVQLGAVKTSQEAQKEINRLKKFYPQVFKNCELIAKHVDLGQKGIFYRIQTLGMQKEEAEKTVEMLKKMKQACFVVKP